MKHTPSKCCLLLTGFFFPYHHRHHHYWAVCFVWRHFELFWASHLRERERERERVKWKAHTFLGNHSCDHFPSHEEGFQRDNSATRCASLPRHTTLHTRREAHTAWVERAQRVQVKTITPWLITSSTLAGEQDNRTCHRTHANCRPETLSLRWRMISSRSLLSFILPAQLITTVFSAVVHSLLHTSFACTEFSRLVLL